MFGKLLKYEIKSIGKWYLGLLFITSLVAIATGNSVKRFITTIETSSYNYVGYQVGSYLRDNVMFLFLLAALFGLLIAVTIASYVIIIRRFYASLFSRQGYLTMTLPVSTHSILLSKLLVSTLLFITTYLLFAIIILAFVLPHVEWSEVVKVFSEVMSKVPPSESTFWFIVWNLDAFLSTILAVLWIYLAISIGQLFNTYRVLMGFVSYGIIWLILTLISFLLAFTFTDGSLILVDLVMTIVGLIASYIATHAIIKHKLNLE
ncbi:MULTISPECIES: ABC transporter permease [Streptococcus]|uniref:ABC transporter permease n=1 Tax=Streptococcus caledonicus TaxID=2614158 RepID=A0ABW0UFE1_9STRE|nr:ABC transporter permease [Streptococcus sp. S784/96/1]